MISMCQKSKQVKKEVSKKLGFAC